MRPTVSQYAEALETLTKEGMSASELTRNFLGFLKRRGESDRAVSVVEQLEKRALVQSGTLLVQVVTAHEMGAEGKTLLTKQAQQFFPGTVVSLQYVVDPTIIGGARFRAEETLYDASIRAKLSALKKIIQK